jgi:hypothetical protein
MADKTIFGRLQKLFSTNTIVRKTDTGVKVIDTDEYQSMTTNLVDRYTKLKVTNSYGTGLAETSMAYQQVRIDLFRDYDSMDMDPILASALDIYADECTARNEMGSVLKLHHEDDNIKQILENLFYDILNVEFNLWPWTRNLVKYGDFFLQLEMAEGLGIVNVSPLSCYEMTRIEGFDIENPQRVKFAYQAFQNPYSGMQSTKTEYENYEIAHFRLNSDSNFLPYGKSMIEGGRRVWKQLQLMEDAMLIHRVMRAPEKRIFKVDVGNIPPNEVDNYMQKIINASKKVPFVDEKTGEYNLKYNIQNLIEDYYMPVRGSDNGTSIDTLKGLEYNMIDDINYLKGKLMAALKIPKAYLGYEEDTNGKATLAAMDIRFAKTIERVQRVLVSELTKIAIVHLYAQGIEDDRLTNFSIELTIPSKIYEQEQVELYTSKVALIQQMQQTKMFSKEWMYQAVMKMAKDEQDELTLQVLDDTKQTFRLTSIETQGVDPAKETGVEGGPTNVEEEIQKIQAELAEEGQVGRPKDPVRYGKDDHPQGRDPLGIKTLKQKEGSVKYKPRNSYTEIFKDMIGNKKTILTEDLNKK